MDQKKQVPVQWTKKNTLKPPIRRRHHFILLGWTTGMLPAAQ